MSIYHYDILKSGLGAVPSGVYRVRLCINVPCVSLEWFEEVCFQTEQLREYGGKYLCEGFPCKFRQSIMGRVRSGTCRRGRRRGGEELMHG